MKDARAIAEETARASYGRLLAWLTSRTRDIAAAEDALSDAFAAALVHWPRSGVPDSPEAWLLTAAKRKLIDGARRAKTRSDAEPAIMLALEEADAMTREDRFVDERLKLLFICAHPAIDAAARTPMMLQTVLGLDAARIASAFLVAPSTMSQRLVRAKRKIANANIPFVTPDQKDLEERSTAVLESIYAAFSVGYDNYDGADSESDDLAWEARFLANLVAELLPDNAEALGLAALISYVQARRHARRPDGVFVTFDDQDTALWDHDMIAAGNQSLSRAAALWSPGRFQLEAAIQSAHLTGRLTGDDTRQAVVNLYDRLLNLEPSVGAEIARAAALVKTDRAAAAVAALDAIDAELIKTHQPYWAALAHARSAAGDKPGATVAIDRAIGLTTDPAIRAFLSIRRRALA